jgi:hypothetical protein
MLEDRGYKVVSGFLSFYEVFGNLSFFFDVNGNERKISFIISKSFGIDYDEIIINVYPKMIGCESLTLIGNIDGTSILVIDEKNILYSIYDGNITKYGHVKQAIEDLFNKDWREFTELFLEKDLENLDINWKYVHEKEIENNKKFAQKYG